jgi:RNA-binding protein YhbY
MKETARKMAEAVGAKIADVRGFTVTLEKISR